MALGDRIKKKRDERGMTLKELAEKVGVTEATMSRYESNKIKNPSHGKLKEMASVLNVDINYLMDWENADEDTQYAPVTEDERDLLRIYRTLKHRERTELLGKAYELERISKNNRNH